MFKNRKVKKLFQLDDPKLIYYIRNKHINLHDVFKSDEDLLANSIIHHKNTIAEAELKTYCDNVNFLTNENQSYLMLAIQHNNEYMFKKLMEHNPKLDIVDNNRETAIFYAIKSDNRLYFDMLMAERIDVKGFNNNGENTAIYAYIHDKKEIALELLNNKVFINHIDKDGNTILHHAVINNDVDFALALIELGADVFIHNYNDQSVLDIGRQLQQEELIINKTSEIVSQLFENENFERINELLEDNFDVTDYATFNIPFLIAYNAVKYKEDTIFGKIIRNTDLLNSVDYRGNSLLMYCIEFGRFLMARKIIYLDVNLNLKNNNNKTALFILLEKILDTKEDEQVIAQYKQIFKELIECYVDVNIQDDEGNTVLMVAIRLQESEIIEQLINYRDIDLNLSNDEGKTALIIAYELKDLSTVHKIIISRKADINVMDKEHKTLLLLAMLDDDIDLFSALLHNGADLNLQYNGGMSILMIALNTKKIRFVAKIFEYNFNVDLKDDEGMTALMHAIKVRSYNAVKALLKLGANKRLTNKAGNSPIYLALDLNALDIAKLLKTSDEL